MTTKGGNNSRIDQAARARRVRQKAAEKQAHAPPAKENPYVRLRRKIAAHWALRAPPEKEDEK